MDSLGETLPDKKRNWLLTITITFGVIVLLILVIFVVIPGFNNKNEVNNSIPVNQSINQSTNQSINQSNNTNNPNNFVCDVDFYNCNNFTTRTKAQAVYNACLPGDIHGLDNNGDGEACESLPEN
ncbi:MAG: excalibur calcium-binding domain-containing protein [Nanoarchaeota archaeon]|nr:excalibur calcium-binding domain-containing protein [Nanoarchaeota archaeon]